MQQGSLGVQARCWLALAIACQLYAAAPAQAAVVSLLASGPASVLVGDRPGRSVTEPGVAAGARA